MELVSARLRADVGNGAGAARILGGEVVGLNNEFLDEIGGGLRVRPSAQPLIRHSVKKESVEIGAITVDVGLEAARRAFHVDLGRVHGAGNQLHQLINVATVERHIGNLGTGHQVLHPPFTGVDQRRCRFHGDRLSFLTNLERGVNPERLVSIQNKIRVDISPKALGFHLDGVRRRKHSAEHIVARGGTLCRALCPRGLVGDGHNRAWYDGAAGVSHQTGDTSPALCEKRACANKCEAGQRKQVAREPSNQLVMHWLSPLGSCKTATVVMCRPVGVKSATRENARMVKSA
jgi:hypothetical protein